MVLSGSPTKSLVKNVFLHVRNILNLKFSFNLKEIDYEIIISQYFMIIHDKYSAYEKNMFFFVKKKQITWFFYLNQIFRLNSVFLHQ